MVLLVMPLAWAFPQAAGAGSTDPAPATVQTVKLEKLEVEVVGPDELLVTSFGWPGEVGSTHIKDAQLATLRTMLTVSRTDKTGDVAFGEARTAVDGTLKLTGLKPKFAPGGKYTATATKGDYVFADDKVTYKVAKDLTAKFERPSQEEWVVKADTTQNVVTLTYAPARRYYGDLSRYCLNAEGWQGEAKFYDFTKKDSKNSTSGAAAADKAPAKLNTYSLTHEWLSTRLTEGADHFPTGIQMYALSAGVEADQRLRRIKWAFGPSYRPRPGPIPDAVLDLSVKATHTQHPLLGSDGKPTEEEGWSYDAGALVSWQRELQKDWVLTANGWAGYAGEIKGYHRVEAAVSRELLDKGRLSFRWVSGERPGVPAEDDEFQLVIEVGDYTVSF